MALGYLGSSTIRPPSSWSVRRAMIRVSSATTKSWIRGSTLCSVRSTMRTRRPPRRVTHFPIPERVDPDDASLSGRFIKLIRSYRDSAQVARTWPNATPQPGSDHADAQAGITADHFNVTSTTNGPGGGWRRIYDGGTTASDAGVHHRRWAMYPASRGSTSRSRPWKRQRWVFHGQTPDPASPRAPAPRSRRLRDKPNGEVTKRPA
jgi:hypothetical protein